MEDAKIVRRGPFIQFPPLVTSNVTLVQQQHQKTEIDTILRSCSDLTVLCVFILASPGGSEAKGLL